MPFQFITREDWYAMKVEYEYEKLPSPIQTIQLVANTDSDYCLTRGDCGETVQEMQRVHIQEDRYHDINYNFVIGGDGNVYEGRGWERKVQQMPHWPSNTGTGLVIGFIGGDLSANAPSMAIFQALNEFIMQYCEEGKLSKERAVEIKM